ncbi:hypothetical protein N7519_005590 [Penicillium mononematosum]|uniref:uncharacterized protein n=1 Tax=Penicillium mononematosum TaxID=268346 RepID=UPI00254909A0|nr:uncharacterized protein N7519_005590 [Penicillium mononematosum]KAJ6184289.1 hypothetical protein N7519_005590 [Penicillium mononematosum]
METVNRYVSAASNVIWGENSSPHAQQHGEEPISGVQGKGQATDPYDGGNRDDRHITTYGSKKHKCPIYLTPHPAEQPGAIQSDVNTAPLGSLLKKRHSKSQETEITSITTPRPPTSITACTSITPALPISGDPTTASGSSDNNTSKQEQRSISQAEGGESSEAPPPSSSPGQALQGPQGAPRAADDFEKDYRTMKSAGRDEDSENGSPSESSGKSNGSPSSNGVEPTSLGSEKSGRISKVKESVKRHLHHSSK